MTLARLAPGRRFALRDMPSITGTLVNIGEGSALVVLDGQAKVIDIETGEGQWVRFVRSGDKRQTISKFVDVTPIQ